MTLRHKGSSLTDVGLKREHNEDSHLVDDSLGLYIVADGMGGHAAGEVASAMCASVIREVVSAHTQVLQALTREASHENKLAAEKLVERAIQEACSRIHAAARKDRSKGGMGTTCDVVLVVGNRAIVGHVGDSRVYLVRQGKVHRLTEDHTMLAAALKAGIVKDKAELEDSDWANSLTRAVGTQPSVQVDTLLVECQPADLFFMCSDGMHGYLDDAEAPGLISSLAKGTPLQSFIDLAKQRGGKDNITALTVALTGDLASTIQGLPIDTRMGILQQIPLFAHLSYKERSAVLAVAAMRSFPADAVIVQEGTQGDDLFIIAKGRVAVEKNGHKLGEVGSGGHFGEMNIVDNAPRSATVRALEPVDLMVIARPQLLAVMRKDSMISVKLLWSMVQSLSERLRTTNVGMVEAMSQQRDATPRGDVPFSAGGG